MEREYRRRINLALEYMQGHLDENPPLRDVARAACFSEYHFHRLFRAFTGESVAACHRRLRLNRAAWQLLHRPERSVTEIALGSGFCSSSDFARAFRRQFGTSPTYYRRGAHAEPRRAAPETYSEAWKRRIDARVRIERLPETNVAYLRCKGLSKRFTSAPIRDAYASLYVWAERRGVLARPVLPAGIYLDSPEIMSMADCRYLACIAVAETAAPDGPIGVMKVGGGSYLCFPFRRASPLFPRRFFRTSQYLYRHWMPEHAYLPADAPVVEIYRLFRGRPRVLELCVPVEACPG